MSLEMLSTRDRGIEVTVLGSDHKSLQKARAKCEPFDVHNVAGT